MGRFVAPEERVYRNSIPEPNSGCWLWMGHVDKDGYSKTKATTGHKLSYTTFKGPVPDGYELDHKCKVRCCVNPHHLEAVTHAENVGRGDYTKNHRNGRKTHCKRNHPLAGNNLIIERNGSRHCRFCINLKAREWTLARKDSNLPPSTFQKSRNARLSENDVLFIRANYPNKSLNQFARQFGVSKSVIYSVVTGKSWRYLLPEFKHDA